MVQVILADLVLVAEDSAPRQAGRAHDQADVLRRAVDISLFEGLIGITLLCTDKAARHLHTIGAFGQGVLQIRTVPDAAGRDNRYMDAVFADEKLLDLPDGCVLIVFPGPDILKLLAQVAADCSPQHGVLRIERLQ